MENNKYDKYLQYVGGVRFWIIATGIIISLAALKQASHIVNIILVAAFLTAISLAPLNWLKKKGLPKSLSIVIVVFLIILIVGLIGLLIGESVNNFMDKLPTYKRSLTTLPPKLTNSWRALG
jgi:predicted PurR-regulated permease PerM